ncbi:MAG: hypothetical protein ACXVHO_07240 [Methanobacterium sp.]
MQIYKGNDLVGIIADVDDDPEGIKNYMPGKRINFAGRDAIEFSDSEGVGAYIFIKDTKGLVINLNPAFSKEYQNIRDSFVIKYPL